MNTYNLLREPWLPVVRADGTRVPIRPSGISAPDIVRIDSGRGDCDIALTELLIGLLAVSLDPHMTGRAWIESWRNPPTEAELTAAFAPFADAFDLDGTGARFFQDIEDLRGKPLKVEALLIEAPINKDGDPSNHFVQPGRIKVLSRRGAACVIATLQTFAPSGGSGHRTSVRGGGPLTTLVVPGAPDETAPTLWHRLWANVPEGFGAGLADAISVFPWLSATRVSHKESPTLITTPLDVHKAQAFFGLPRRIRLTFEPNTERYACDLTGEIDEVVVHDYFTRPRGTNYEGWGKDHPLSPSRKSGADFVSVHLKSSRVGYRQWLGFVYKPHPEHADADNPELPATAITTFFRSRAADLLEDDPTAVRRARLLVAGYALDNMKPLEFGESLLPLMYVAEDARTSVAHLAHAWVEAAELGAKTVGVAVRGGLFGDNPKIAHGATVLENAKAQFWADTEQAFFTELSIATEALSKVSRDTGELDTTKQSAGARWLEAMRRIALSIFDATVPIDTADLKDIDDYKQIVSARRYIVSTFAGQSGDGRKLRTLLNQPEAPKPKKPTKTKETAA